MASKGLRKDSVGISKLSDVDVKNIEKGITNYKFSQSFFSLYSRVYETFWEIDYYFRTGDPNNKTLAQRIEYAKAALYLIKENPVFGIGTGNYMVSFNEAFDKVNSHLLYEKRATSHNQYLNYLVKFGIAGFCIIMILLVWPVYKTENKHNYILILFLISIAVANFGDSNLETHMGLSFFILFYSLFICNSTIEMKFTLS